MIVRLRTGPKELNERQERHRTEKALLAVRPSIWSSANVTCRFGQKKNMTNQQQQRASATSDKNPSQTSSKHKNSRQECTLE